MEKGSGVTTESIPALTRFIASYGARGATVRLDTCSVRFLVLGAILFPLIWDRGFELDNVLQAVLVAAFVAMVLYYTGWPKFQLNRTPPELQAIQARIDELSELSAAGNLAPRLHPEAAELLERAARAHALIEAALETDDWKARGKKGDGKKLFDSLRQASKRAFWELLLHAEPFIRWKGRRRASFHQLCTQPLPNPVREAMDEILTRLEALAERLDVRQKIGASQELDRVLGDLDSIRKAEKELDSILYLGEGATNAPDSK